MMKRKPMAWIMVSGTRIRNQRKQAKQAKQANEQGPAALCSGFGSDSAKQNTAVTRTAALRCARFCPFLPRGPEDCHSSKPERISENQEESLLGGHAKVRTHQSDLNICVPLLCWCMRCMPCQTATSARNARLLQLKHLVQELDLAWLDIKKSHCWEHCIQPRAGPRAHFSKHQIQHCNTLRTRTSTRFFAAFACFLGTDHQNGPFRCVTLHTSSSHLASSPCYFLLNSFLLDQLLIVLHQIANELYHGNDEGAEGQ